MPEVQKKGGYALPLKYVFYSVDIEGSCRYILGFSGSTFKKPLDYSNLKISAQYLLFDQP